MVTAAVSIIAVAVVAMSAIDVTTIAETTIAEITITETSTAATFKHADRERYALLVATISINNCRRVALLLLRPYGPLILQLLNTNRLSWLQDS